MKKNLNHYENNEFWKKVFLMISEHKKREFLQQQNEKKNFIKNILMTNWRLSVILK